MTYFSDGEFERCGQEVVCFFEDGEWISFGASHQDKYYYGNHDE
jgi:hypothetical protein